MIVLKVFGNFYCFVCVVFGLLFVCSEYFLVGGL